MSDLNANAEFKEFQRFRRGKQRTRDPKLSNPAFLIWQAQATRQFLANRSPDLSEAEEFAMFCAATNYAAYQHSLVSEAQSAVSSPEELVSVNSSPDLHSQTCLPTESQPQSITESQPQSIVESRAESRPHCVVDPNWKASINDVKTDINYSPPNGGFFAPLLGGFSRHPY